MAEWFARATDMLNPAHWNMPRLLKDKEGRKPQAYLLLELTEGTENLVLDWYPDKPPIHHPDETDFPYWSNYRHPGSPQPNRLVMMHSVHHLLPWKGPAPHSIKYLLKAHGKHIHYIAAVLRKLLDVELLTDMHFGYRTLPVREVRSPDKYEKEELVRCDILDDEIIQSMQKPNLTGL